MLPVGAATDQQDTLPLENIETAPVPKEPVARISSPEVPAASKREKYQYGKGKGKDDESKDDVSKSAPGIAAPDQDAATCELPQEEQSEEEEEEEA